MKVILKCEMCNLSSKRSLESWDKVRHKFCANKTYKETFDSPLTSFVSLTKKLQLPSDGLSKEKSILPFLGLVLHREVEV